MLPRRHRLNRPDDFRAALRGNAGSQSRRAAERVLVVHRLDRGSAGHESPAPSRVGLVVSKTVGNSVVRHRVARRLRALMAERIATLPAGTDVVLRAMPAAATADHRELAHALDRALRRVEQ